MEHTKVICMRECLWSVLLKEADAGQVQESGLEAEVVVSDRECVVERNWAQRHQASWLHEAAAAQGPGHGL